MKHGIGISLAWILALSVGCQNGSVNVFRIANGKPVLLARAQQTTVPTVSQAVQALKEELLPSANSPSNSQAPSIQMGPLPVLKVKDLEPVIPPPANTPVVNQPAVQEDKHTVSSSSSGGGSGSSSGHNHFNAGASTLTPQPDRSIRIDDVVLTETRESVVGANSPAAVTGSYDEDKQVRLTIKGDFTQLSPRISYDSMLFTLADQAMSQLTWVDKSDGPGVRVALWDVLLFSATQNVSNTSLDVTLSSFKLGELMLKGLHRLSVSGSQLSTETLIRVGPPDKPPQSLSPVINSVSVVYNDQQKPVNLIVKGKGWMSPKFNYCQVNGAFSYSHQLAIFKDGTSELEIHLPDPVSFDPAANNSVVCSTPFGSALKQFTTGGQQS